MGGKSGRLRLYGLQSWRRRAAHQLAAHPLCAFCERMGRTTAAEVADHIEPVHGDPAKFLGPLQSLCRRCHETIKKADEARGFSVDVDPATGWPIDARHPFWTGRLPGR